MVPYQQLAVADPLARALEIAGYSTVGWIVALGAAVSMSAVLLVFQYGQPRIFFADGARRPAAEVGREGAPGHPRAVDDDAAHRHRGRGGIGVRRRRSYDLTNIGTLFAFAIVSIGVVVLRVVEPDCPRPFRVPLVWVVGPLGAAACGFIMIGLPTQAWERFGLWLVLGLIVYLGYGARHSRLRQTPAA